MKPTLFILASLCLAACAPKAVDPDTSNPAHNRLTTYEASEFEPSWFLKLTGGDTLAFTQLDPVAGNDLVTYRYEVTQQSPPRLMRSGMTSAWDVRGGGPTGEIKLEILMGKACTHSGSGYTHRDTVLVTTSKQILNGCGGPSLEEP